MTAAIHQSSAVRKHRSQFRIGEAINMRRLGQALGTLEDLEEALVLALRANNAEAPTKSLIEVRAALRLLAHGPKGAFR